MRLIVAGSRTVTDERFVHKKLEALTADYKFSSADRIDVECCGLAQGPDLIGKDWAGTRGIPVKEFVPDWEGLGNRAGILRNEEMGDYAHAQGQGWLIAFLDVTNDTLGTSGTRHMISYAKMLGMRVDVVRCKCVPLKN